MILLNASNTYNVPSSAGLFSPSEIALVPELSFCQKITFRYAEELSTPHNPSVLNTLFHLTNSERGRMFFRRRTIIKLWYYNVCGLGLAQTLAFYDNNWFNILITEMSISDFTDFCKGDKFPCVVLYYVDSIRDEAVLLDQELEILGQSIHPNLDDFPNTPGAQLSPSSFTFEDYI